jgi:hypothetical protein
MTIRPIVELGEAIERTWQARDYDRASFPDLCSESLFAAQLSERVSPEDIVHWSLGSDLPSQVDPQGKFGQPPITLFRSRRFFIDALFWVDGTTAIHDHNFSGAFQVLSGSSIETTFRFDVEQEIDGHFQMGSLSVRKANLFKASNIQQIQSGPTFIHSLFHLLRPSVSIVIRTFWEPRPGVQLRYYPAGLAHDVFLENDARERHVQIVKMLRDTENTSFASIVGDLLARADIHTSFAIIQVCSRCDSRIQETILQRVRNQNVAKVFRKWLADERRLRLLRAARTNVRDPDLRFMLGVLLNVHCRPDALALVSAYVPGNDPARQIAAWLRQLSTTSTRLQIGGVPWEPNILGLPAFEDGFEVALSNVLGERGSPVGDAERKFLDQLSSLAPLEPLFRRLVS